MVGRRRKPAFSVTVEMVPVFPGGGRHIEHDSRSRAFAVPALAAAKLTSQRWERRSPILDQGERGSCVGNAAAGWLATDNAQRRGRADITEATAVELYHQATVLDSIKGNTFPPTDAGSTGLGGGKALVKTGGAGAYRHAFSLNTALAALEVGPVMVGTMWLEGCDEPDRTGLVRYTGRARGGHEYLADGKDLARGVVWFQNSWGEGFGVGGRFCMTIPDFGRALKDHGDVTQPHA